MRRGCAQLECWIGDGGDESAGHEINLPSLSTEAAITDTSTSTINGSSVLLFDYAVGSLRLRNTGKDPLPMLGLLELRYKSV